MKGKYAGCGMHIEYHTVNPKKEKAANCIYLTTNRTCRNKESLYYLEKCFVASCCPLKVKEKGSKELLSKKNGQLVPVKKELNSKRIQCTLPPKCPVQNKFFGSGAFVGYREESKIILVQFGEKVMRFQYPNAILDGHLVLPKDAFARVLHDISKAEWE